MIKRYGRTHRKRKKKLNYSIMVNSNIESQKYCNLLCQWMGAKGYKPSKKLCPVIFKDSGRGLMAKERILKGDIIISIPGKLLITPAKVLEKSYLGEYFEKYCSNTSGHEILSIFLMCERIKSQTSEWYPYLSSLPESFDIPAFHDGYPFSALPMAISSVAAKQIETVKSSYEKLKPLLESLEQAYPFFRGAFNINLYKWAWCAVNTRCVYIDCFREDCTGKSCSYHLALAPYLDLLNHSSKVQVLAGYNSESNQYEIRSLSDFKKYSQVFINYGSHDNCTLLIEYGFIINENHNHTIPFSLGDINDAWKQCPFENSFSLEKIKFIISNNLLSNATCSCDGLSWNLIIILKILASENHLKYWKSILTNGLKLSSKEELKYEILKKKVLCSKLENYNVIFDKNLSITYSYFQKIIEELLASEKEILIKALK